MNFKIIYIDESTINNKNNNFRCFRKSDENIYFNIENTKKLNLIMAIDNSSVIYFEINYETTTQESFLKFMENFVKTIKEKKIVKYVIVMDNSSCHKTEKLISFYYKNKINILFNTPYISQWNSIELAFRAIKRDYYQKLFSNIELLKNYGINIINSEDFLKTLPLNYCETLR